jgi:hypothetical protein
MRFSKLAADPPASPCSHGGQAHADSHRQRLLVREGREETLRLIHWSVYDHNELHLGVNSRSWRIKPN